MSDLNRRVATALGKRVVTIASDDDWHSVEEQDGLVAYAPLPDYAHDLNAAYGLWVGHQQWLDIMQHADGTSLKVGGYRSYSTDRTDGTGLAHLLCEAWLDDHEERKRAGQGGP